MVRHSLLLRTITRILRVIDFICGMFAPVGTLPKRQLMDFFDLSFSPDGRTLVTGNSGWSWDSAAIEIPLFLGCSYPPTHRHRQT